MAGFSVADSYADITKRGGKLMQGAKTRGLGAANSRGLLNSSMAVRAAEDSIAETALPMASQDSQQAWQSSEAALDRYQESTENKLNRDWQTGENYQDREWQTRDNAADRYWRSGESYLDRQYQSSESALERDLTRETRDKNLAFETNRSQAQLAVSLEQLYSENYRSLLSNPEIEWEERYDQHTSNRNWRAGMMHYVQQLYDPGFTFTW